MTQNLAVEAIFTSMGAKSAVRAESFLEALSEPEWATLRTTVARSRRTGDPLLRCGDCHGPVFARESVQYRRHCVHYGAEVKNCRWAMANAGNLCAIDAEKFRGRQEGERHKSLKRMVETVLHLDPATSAEGTMQERFTKGVDGDYAYPDVFAASWQGAPAAFEIQLATTHVPIIEKRESFYRRNRIRLCWLVGAESSKRLELRTFKDIHLRNGGQILGIDADVVREALADHAPKFRLYRLLPGPASDRFEPSWQNRVVGVEGIDWGMPGDRPRSVGADYDDYLDAKIVENVEFNTARLRFYAALGKDDLDGAAMEWD